MKKQLILTTVFCAFLLKINAQTPPQYQTQILTLSIPVGKLEGTLVLPNAIKNPPLVFIIAGSGPTDRDCNSAVGLKTNAFKMLADSFAQLGIATFRYDKRGVGASKITQKATDVTFDDFINDAVRWVDTLKSLKTFSKIIVLGHSEGSLIGSIAVQRTIADKFISLCGMPLTMDSMLYYQIGKQIPAMVPPLKEVFEKWKRGEKVDSINPIVRQLANPASKNFMVSIMRYVPQEELAKVPIPTLLVGGKNDVQVVPEHLVALASAKPASKLIFFDKMTHILKNGTTNLLETQLLYTKTDVPITEGVAKILAEFIR